MPVCAAVLNAHQISALPPGDEPEWLASTLRVQVSAVPVLVTAETDWALAESTACTPKKTMISEFAGGEKDADACDVEALTIVVAAGVEVSRAIAIDYVLCHFQVNWSESPEAKVITAKVAEMNMLPADDASNSPASSTARVAVAV